MKIIKKLDLYILRNFLLLFAATFFVCLFIFMMQFLWKYINDLVGKGLGWDVIAQFFYYSSLTLIPMSIPLAVLLASLISFGNMGEKLELLSMKAAGVPLVRILFPTMAVSAMICAFSFYFENTIQPYATRQMATLVWSMRQKSPEVEIPEGIFYNNIPGYSLYVEQKNIETGMLYGVMIYAQQTDYEKMEIVLADSARLQSTAEKMHLKLTLYGGERFRNMDAQTGQMLKANVPYMRETFLNETDLIPFDANFNMMDANLFNGNAQTKGLKSIYLGIDSIREVRDSLGHEIYHILTNQYLRGQLPEAYPDSISITVMAKRSEPFDSLYAHLSGERQRNAIQSAMYSAQSAQSELDFRSLLTGDVNVSLRRYRLEAERKFTLALSCIIFFFIGAPLGAIIRKGGLGVPVVVSVLIFIFYYIINAGGEKGAKSGTLPIWFGAWVSTMVLAPIGFFLIYKANKDSVVFNVEGYRNFFMRLLGLRMSRKLNRKEVIIHDPGYARLEVQLEELAADCRKYSQNNNLLRMPSYLQIYFHYADDHEVSLINDRLEAIIEELHNSSDNVVIDALNQIPILDPTAHTRPFMSGRLNLAVGLFLPLGIVWWVRIWRYRIRLYRDMNTIISLCHMIHDRIDLQVLASEIERGMEPPET